jgi:hypothetical protein
MITQRSGCITVVLTLILIGGVALYFGFLALIKPVEAEETTCRNQFGHRVDCPPQRQK